ncbi:MAG TPA: type II 3-dehydroquinate dehydratase [Myxococcaceae bacterium]|nr:type II 3-dehydroquinate dehydratase [Myxococcaceae bacterium]
MPMNILVLHGPNLNLLGERPGDAPDGTLEALNRRIREKAVALGQEVKIFQSNHEGVLVDRLHDERKWADAVLLSPAGLAHSSWALREAVQAVGKPVVEVHLGDLVKANGKRRRSLLKDVCAERVLGKGFDSYLVGLERLASGELTGKPARQKTLGRREPGATDAPIARKGLGPKVREEVKAEKTLGKARAAEPSGKKSLGSGRAEKTLGPGARGGEKKAGAEKSLGRKDKAAEPAGLSRDQVRRMIADRLAGKLTPMDLTVWAKAQWLEVQRGAAIASGERDLVEESLLTLSSMPHSKLTDDQLVELMAKLG